MFAAAWPPQQSAGNIQGMVVSCFLPKVAATQEDLDLLAQVCHQIISAAVWCCQFENCFKNATSSKRASLLGARMLLVAPGIATSSKKLLGWRPISMRLSCILHSILRALFAALEAPGNIDSGHGHEQFPHVCRWGLRSPVYAALVTKASR